MPNKDRIEAAFTYHRPDAAGVEAITELRQRCKALAYTIEALAPDGREKSTALTKLEEVMMWASAGIVRPSA